MKPFINFFLLKPFKFLVILYFLTSCSSINSEKIAPSFGLAIETIRGSFFGYPDIAFNQEIIDNIPYASAILKIGKGPKGLIILESINDKKTTWVSKDKVFIVIKDGRIIRTLGLSNNLASIQTQAQTFEDQLQDTKSITKYFSYYSFSNPELHDLKVQISISNRGLREVEILGKKRNLILFEEKISNEIISWRVTNKYWVDPEDYFVWKSEQNLTPKLPTFQLEITKRPEI